MDQIATQNSTGKLAPSHHLSPQHDEIDLISLWLILVERKKIILTAVALSILAGITVIATRTDTYTYRTSIEIGKNIGALNKGGDSKEAQLIEPITSTLAKLTEAYIPLTLSEYTLKEKSSIPPPRISAKIPQDSDIILLESVGTEDARNEHILMHNQVLKRITDDHSELLLAPRQAILDQIVQLEFELSKLEAPNRYQLQLSKYEEALVLAQKKLADLTDPRLTDVTEKELVKNIADAEAGLATIISNKQLLEEKLAQFDELKKLILEEVKELETSVSEHAIARANATKEAADEAKAMTILLIDNSAQKIQQRLSSLKKKLHIDLITEKTQLENKISENIISQEKQRKQISILRSKLIRAHAITEKAVDNQTPIITRLKLELDNFKDEHERKVTQLNININRARNKLLLIKDTHAVTPTETIAKTNISSSTILALSTILGILAGVIAALLSSFFECVKQRQKNNYSPLTHNTLGNEQLKPAPLVEKDL